MLSSILFAMLALLATVSVSAQTPENPCPKGDKECLLVELTTNDGEGTTGSVNFSFDYVPSTGEICYINSVTVNKFTGTGSFGDAGGAQIPGRGSKVTLNAAGTLATNLVVTSFTTSTTTTTNGVVPGSGSFGVYKDNTALSGTTDNLAYVDYTRVPSGKTSTFIQQVLPNTLPGLNTCGLGLGDPHFSGFLGQQFDLEGEGGLTYNVLSASNVQLNTRLVQLNVGDALTRGEMRMARLKSLFVLPNTYWFDHAGPYMGELGVSMLNGHQLYAQAGAYQSGFATVQLDGANMSVSSQAVVLGEGASAVTVSRPSAYQLVVSTASVSLSFTNSDHFFNIENAKLLGDFDFQATPMGGALGQTANAAFMAHNKDSKWRKQVELDALVESNDLFTLSAPAGTVAA